VVENQHRRVCGSGFASVSGTTMVREVLPFQQERVRRMDQGKKLALAFCLFADAHGNQLPQDFEQLKSFTPKESFSDSNWEIRSSGSLNSFTTPGRTILLREKEASKSPRGDFTKVYVFADGHAEYVYSPDGDFTAMEVKRKILFQASHKSPSG
jgi:hypothetical protein